MTRAARAARVVSSAVTKRTAETLRRKANPEKQRSEQEEKERSREDGYDEGSTSSSSLSSLSSQSEFELSEEEGEEESLTASRYFQRPAPPEIKKQKRAATVVKKEPAAKKEDTKREPAPSLGDIVPAIIKREGKRKGKRVKGGNAPPKTEPPPYWEEMYDAVREMRSRIPAPVDTMGCERLADGASTPKVCFSHHSGQIVPDIEETDPTVSDIGIPNAFQPDERHRQRYSHETAPDRTPQ